MILSCYWISLPCLSRSVIIRFFPRLCVLVTLFKLLDASIVFRISSNLCFRISSLAFFLRSYIFPYIMLSLGVMFSFISLIFFIRALSGDDIFGFFRFLVCFAMLIALCWIISVKYRVSVSSSYASAVNLFFSSSLNVNWVSTLVCVILFRSVRSGVYCIMETIITIRGQFHC